MKKYISDKNFDLSRVDFVIIKGKETFTKEIWVLGKDKKQPNFERPQYNFDNLTEKYLYALVYFGGEPPYEEFTRIQIDFNYLSQIIKRNPNYKILLKIGKNSAHYDSETKIKISPKEYVRKIEKLLFQKYQTNKNRFTYKIVKDSEIAEFYIVPKGCK